MSEVTDKYIQISMGKRKKKDVDLRTISISKGIKALYDTSTKVINTYLFDEESYSTKQAKEWVKNHKESAEHAALVNIDYVLNKREALNAQYKTQVMSKLEE